MRPLVIKLGGSLIGSSALGDWLAAVTCLPGRAILVPGGGPFADAVRTAQAKLGFGDAAAHAMAILAMEQYAHALLDLAPALAPCATRAELTAARHGVWLPARLALAASDIPPSWDVTSDTLAAWLACEIEASGLALVKRAGAPTAGSTPLDWAAEGLVDPAFPAAAARFGGPVTCLGDADPSRLAAFATTAAFPRALTG
jgi:aspartokinase-like uncharacterized kinase